MKYVLYNPLASNKNGEKKAKTINEKCPNPYYEFVDITKIDREEIIKLINSEDEIVLAGGDGTLNKFINIIPDEIPDKPIYFYPTGSGNDFLRDVNEEDKEGELIRLNKYLKKLPKITVDGQTHKFINGAGYGIDGYACAMVEQKMKDNGGKKGSYVLQAFIGFLNGYTPGKAKITIDGVTNEYENVWMISAMNGRYFGGGVMIAPSQDRLNSERKVSIVVVSTKHRLRALTAFPSIFKGKHLKYTNLVQVFEGNSVSVEIDSPASLQVDGEPMYNVTSYTVETEKN